MEEVMAGGRPRKLPPDADIYREHIEDGLTFQQLADKYGASRSAVSNAVKRVKDATKRAQEAVLPPFPWVIAEGHTKDRLYDAVNAYRRHNAGFACTRDEVQLANAVREHSQKRGGAVISYDYELGFVWTNRLPSDGEAMFVVRPNVARAPGR
jgi:predicted DNA-binding protein YlxM (UPF0122 family)